MQSLWKNRIVSKALIVLLLVTGVALSASLASANDPVAAAIPPNSGVNIDVPFNSDPVCGFQITVKGKKPSNFYLGARNPWGNPTIQEVPPGSSIWVLTFGGKPTDPCYQRNNPIFWENGVVGGKFLGLHFGFWTEDGLVDILSGNRPCTIFGPGGTFEPCSGMTGHTVRGWRFLDVRNAGLADVAVANVQVAFAPAAIEIDVLAPDTLTGLDWRPIGVANPIVPAAQGDVPGILTLEVPSDLVGRNGYAVFTFDVLDPKSSETLNTVTIEFPLQ